MHKLIFAIALGLMWPATYAYALGLGDITVNSALNQQLDARIKLISAVPEDAEVLLVGLASREAFSKAGVDRPHSLTELKFKTIVEGKNVFINVTSSSPIRDPSINFLIEMDWPKGHLLREYTILLEPPSFLRKTKKVEESSRPAVSDMEGNNRFESE